MKLENIIKEVCNIYKIGNLVSYEKENSSQNDVYKVITDKGIYILKEFSKDAIGNYYHLNKRNKQIAISLKLKKHDINTIIPIKLNRNYFFTKNKKYYLLYNYEESKVLHFNDLDSNHIAILARTQAKIHKLKLKEDLPCTYKKIILDFNKYLKKYKNDKDIYEVLTKNYERIENLIKNCNDNLSEMKRKLCISHNDYKLKNILWNDYNLTLIDFDATGPVNHACALAESSFTFSKINNEKINFDYYKLYLKEYIIVYGSFKEDYKKALYVSMNGKLRWYIYLLSKGDKEGIIAMTKELALFWDNIDNFYSLYQKVNK